LSAFHPEDSKFQFQRERREGNRQRIMDILSQEGRMSFTELLDQTGLSRPTLAGHLKRMRQNGTIKLEEKHHHYVLSRGSPKPPRYDSATPQASSRDHLLIVSDDEPSLNRFKTALEPKGYAVVTARDGKEAVEKSRGKHYDLTLIDLRLWDMEEIEALVAVKDTDSRMVRADLGNTVLTGSLFLENAIEAFDQSAEDCFLNPLDMNQLLI